MKKKSSIILSKEERKEILIVIVDGLLELKTCKKFLKFVNTNKKFYNNIAFDFKNLIGIDSSGIAMIVHILKDIRNNSGRVFVINIPEKIQKIIDTTKVTSFMNCIKERELNRMFPPENETTKIIKKIGGKIN